MPPKLSSGMLPCNFFTLLFILCLCMCVSTHVPQYACRDQRTTYRNWLSPTMWVPGTKVMSSDLATGVFIRLATSATYYVALYIWDDEMQNKSLWSTFRFPTPSLFPSSEGSWQALHKHTNMFKAKEMLGKNSVIEKLGRAQIFSLWAKFFQQAS